MTVSWIWQWVLTNLPARSLKMLNATLWNHNAMSLPPFIMLSDPPWWNETAQRFQGTKTSRFWSQTLFDIVLEPKAVIHFWNSKQSGWMNETYRSIWNNASVSVSEQMHILGLVSQWCKTHVIIALESERVLKKLHSHISCAMCIWSALYKFTNQNGYFCPNLAFRYSIVHPCALQQIKKRIHNAVLWCPKTKKQLENYNAWWFGKKEDRIGEIMCVLSSANPFKCG